ncbi:MAG: aconitase X swivel domain-containing protein [Sulfolobales archaeon]
MDSIELEFTGRTVVEGKVSGRILVVNDYISFLGEVDRRTGELLKEGYRGIKISGKILVFKGSKGSTVGPYVVYGLCKNGLGPSGMIIEKADQLVIISAVLCNIVTVEVKELSKLINKIPNDALAEISADEKSAVVKIHV